MTRNPLQDLRLSLMNDVLPIGFGLVDRFRRGNGRSAVEDLAKGQAGVQDLGRDGEDAARRMRDLLDRMSPGLGNPVVEVAVEELQDTPGEVAATPQEAGDLELLRHRLLAMRGRLRRLEVQLTSGED
ncbi:MAG: hypothetical protein ERJ67_01420 [Aphanocapsa feldmannii 277cV]|nr:MAG: hypothetical protein ERJ69_08085 [Aphanocapsa feldmannii 288cV]TGG94796.1 MAG: hypothetical protein ERJ67_01420 [Aphanocapsa feldmannii 277cV]